MHIKWTDQNSGNNVLRIGEVILQILYICNTFEGLCSKTSLMVGEGVVKRWLDQTS